MRIHATRMIRTASFLAVIFLLASCATGGGGFYTSGGYYGTSIWNDPYYNRPCCYGTSLNRPFHRPSITPGRPSTGFGRPSIPSRPRPSPMPMRKR